MKKKNKKSYKSKGALPEAIEKKKVIVPALLWLTQIYLEKMHKYLEKFIGKEMNKVKKEFGKKILEEITGQLEEDNGDIFKKMDLEREEMKKKLSKKDFNKWDRTQVKKFVACANINDLSHYCDFFYSSLLILSFSLFEGSLNVICKKLQEKKKLKIKINDIKGGGMYKAHVYLEKICLLKTPSSALFNELSFICKIRNHLAHNNGVVNDERLVQKINSHKHIKIVEEFGEKRIFFEKEFCRFVIQKCDQYLLELIRKNQDSLFNWRVNLKED